MCECNYQSRNKFVKIDVRLDNQINLTRTKQRTKIHTRAATRSNRNQKGPAAPATSDTFVVRCLSLFLGGWGIMLVGDFDDVDVAYSCGR